MNTLTSLAVVCLVAISGTSAKISGSGRTTRYWDCCKPSCSWKENVGKLDPVLSCAADGVTRVSPSIRSACDDGTSYVCNKFQPWAVNRTLAYGFAAASFTTGVDNSQCCICLKLKFKGALAGKTLIVQNINTGGDLSHNHFDIQIPGGGVGIFTRGCQTQWNAPPLGWGRQYGGIQSEAECNQLPKQLQSGCHWRFNWYENADNPDVDFEQIVCPRELTRISGCVNNKL